MVKRWSKLLRTNNTESYLGGLVFLKSSQRGASIYRKAKEQCHLIRPFTFLVAALKAVSNHLNEMPLLTKTQLTSAPFNFRSFTHSYLVNLILTYSNLST